MLTKFDPFGNELDLRRGFNYLNSMVNNLEERGLESGISSFTPVINSREDKDAYYVEIDLPGIKKEDVIIDVKDNVISISGERKVKKEVKKESYYKMESKYGKFLRSFTLPENVNVDKISAKGENGVVEVVIPKHEVSKKTPKKIAIK